MPYIHTTQHTHTHTVPSGMNAAVRATVRVGLYTGAKVYFVHEVNVVIIFFFYWINPLICAMSKQAEVTKKKFAFLRPGDYIINSTKCCQMWT